MIGSTPISGTSAPFVQWLGHQIFTLETGVRFPYGVPLDNFISVGFPSGQRDQTVNLTALPSKVRILPQPPLKNLTTLKCSFFIIMSVWKILLMKILLQIQNFYFTIIEIKSLMNKGKNK